MQEDEIEGGPAWMDSDRWDIAAKAGSPTAAMLPMIRTLLADRFKLVTHHETRELPVYELVLARRDGRLGPSMRPSTGQSRFQQRIGVLTGSAVPINILVTTLANAGLVRRAVIDRTGLSGTYDIELHWGVDIPAGRGIDVPPSDAPSIFTAVQEQLGLKLESTKGSVDVLVIDHVERPAED
jgi:uncharacterized protein (TIGR03435 family)